MNAVPDSEASVSQLKARFSSQLDDEKEIVQRLLSIVQVKQGKASEVPKDVSKSIEELKESISTQLKSHLEKLGYEIDGSGFVQFSARNKDSLREIQRLKRQEQLISQSKFILEKSEQLLKFIANGNEVNPEAIDPVLMPVESGTIENDIFRFLTLYWSVPVSQGYGRRMRFLILDRQNGKAIGIFGLTDPVFNLRVRDEWIGWTSDQRRIFLRSVLDAYVLGAIPPYSNLLCGKLICTLLSSSEIRRFYREKYAKRQAVISKRTHDNDLLLLTTTSALGKSSLYDRVKLDGRTYFIPVGETKGYGHFHIPEAVFKEMRLLLDQKDHPYAKKNRFGHGPNWRMRVIRVALQECGFNPHLLKHQIRRESFMIPLASNARECLRGEEKNPNFYDETVETISKKALNRWVIPRSIRRPSFAEFERWELLAHIVQMMEG